MSRIKICETQGPRGTHNTLEAAIIEKNLNVQKLLKKILEIENRVLTLTVLEKVQIHMTSNLEEVEQLARGRHEE